MAFRARFHAGPRATRSGLARAPRAYCERSMPTTPPRRHRIVLIALGLAAGLAVVIVVAALVANGGGSDVTPAQAAVTAVPSGGFAGGVLTTPKPVPALALRNSAGQMVDVSADRGRAVFVTFLYTRCPDVCPLTTDNLRIARSKLTPGQRAKVSVIAVSVDPKNDTPAAVQKFLARHRVLGQMNYLVGSAAELQPVWKRWGVAAAADTTDPNFVAHSALIYGIGATGDIETVYSWDAPPADIAHDVPLLLKS